MTNDMRPFASRGKLCVCVAVVLPMLVSPFTSHRITTAPSASPPSFVVHRLPFSATTALHASSTEPNTKSSEKKASRTNHEKLMDDFKTTSGEVVNPYSTLRVPRNADKSKIKKKYYALSKLYHPDKARFSNVLPGKCDNLDEVRDEWERIKLSYEILNNRKQRAAYDRNSALTDPSAAMGRAAMNFVGWGIKGLGKGVFEVGKGVVGAGGAAIGDIKITKEKMRQEDEERAREKEKSVRDKMLAKEEKERAFQEKIREEARLAKEELRRAAQASIENDTVEVKSIHVFETEEKISSDEADNDGLPKKGTA